MVGGALGDFLAFIRGVQVSSAALGPACCEPSCLSFSKHFRVEERDLVNVVSLDSAYFLFALLSQLARDIRAARWGLGIGFFWEEDSLIKLFKALQIFILALMAVSLSAT